MVNVQRALDDAQRLYLVQQACGTRHNGEHTTAAETARALTEAWEAQSAPPQPTPARTTTPDGRPLMCPLCSRPLDDHDAACITQTVKVAQRG
jgi:hypothetical protein